MQEIKQLTSLKNYSEEIQVLEHLVAIKILIGLKSQVRLPFIIHFLLAIVTPILQKAQHL